MEKFIEDQWGKTIFTSGSEGSRPNCKRCGKPLDLVRDPEDGELGLRCNNLVQRATPMMTDEEFQEYIDKLPGDDVVIVDAILSAYERCQ